MVRFVIQERSVVDAAMSAPRPVVKRCLNCPIYPCHKIEIEPNAVVALHDTVISTTCPDFIPTITIAINDPEEIKNLERFANPPSSF